MPRMRINKDEIVIARQGYDVDTADLRNIMFSSNFPMWRLRYTGNINVGPYSGELDDRYMRGVFNFPQGFQRLPMVLVAGLNPDGTTDQSSLYNFGAAPNDTSSITPNYSVEIYRNRFELYVKRWHDNNVGWLGAETTSWNFWVFANPVD